MKTTSDKILDMMIQEGDSPNESESQKLEKQINDTIKQSMEKMQESFDKKLKESEEKINNIILKERNKNNEESNNTEEGFRTDTDKDFNLSNQEEGNNTESEC